MAVTTWIRALETLHISFAYDISRSSLAGGVQGPWALALRCEKILAYKDGGREKWMI